MLADPDYYLNLLESGKVNLKSEKAYEKSKAATESSLDISVSRESPLDLVVDYLLSQCQDITHLSLQKALYYVQGFYYAFFGNFLFKEDCEAWIHGPVYRDIYKQYSGYCYNSMDKAPEPDVSSMPAEEKVLLDNVVKHICCYRTCSKKFDIEYYRCLRLRSYEVFEVNKELKGTNALFTKEMSVLMKHDEDVHRILKIMNRESIRDQAICTAEARLRLPHGRVRGSAKPAGNGKYTNGLEGDKDEVKKEGFMKIKHKYITVFSIITIVLLVGIAATYAIGVGSPTSLSETRIIDLRAKFPIYSDENALAESGDVPIDMTIKSLANAYVMVDVVEQLPDYTYSAILPKGSDLDEILTKQGLSSLDVTCIERSVKIIDIFYQGDSGVKLNPDLSVEIGQIITVINAIRKD